MPEIFAGLGIAGIVTVVVLSSLFCLIQPVWAIVDCVDSDRDRETKVLVSLAIFFTWCCGSVVYGLFFARSGTLRKFTIFSTLILFLVGLAAFMSCVSAITTQSRRAAAEAESKRVEAERKAATFVPNRIAPDAVAPFQAILFASTGPGRIATSLAEFNLNGPAFQTARDIRKGIRHVAHDAEAGRTFALTTHEFGALSPTTGELIQIHVDPSFEFSWPKGIAWDPVRRSVVVMTSHVYTRLYSYDPTTSAWSRLPAEFRDLSAIGLALIPESGVLYTVALAHGARELGELQRFNTRGSGLGPLRLDPAIPLWQADDVQQLQLHSSSGQLVLMLPPGPDDARPARIFVVDPDTGAVSAVPARSPRAPVAAPLAPLGSSGA